MLARRIAAVALALLALVGVALWLLLDPPPLDDATMRSGDSGPATTNRARASAPPLAGAEPNGTRGASAHAAPTPSIRASAASSLLLVDARTGAPLPGAALRFAPWPPSGGIDAFSADQAVDGAAPQLADAAGRVELPPLADGIAVAHTDSLWGWARWRHGAPPPGELRLELDRELRVQVLTLANEPVCNVEILLGGGTQRARLTRAPDGIARFPGASFAPGESGKPVRFVATLNALSVQPYTLELVADDLAGAPRILRAPPVASVEVDVRELDGRAAVDGTRVWLQLDPIDWSDAPLERRERLARDTKRRMHGVTRDGRARFAVAATDVPVYVECWRALPIGRVQSGAAATRWPSARGEGRATRDGSATRIELVLGSEWTVLSGRALDETGAALAHTPLSVRSSAEAPALAETTTGAGGEFWIECNGAEWGPARQIDFATSGTPARRARIDLGADGGAWRRVGDIVLPRALETRWSGRVVGPPGAPRDGVLVSISTASAGGGWQPCAKVTTRAGGFELVVEPGWGALRARASADGWESEPRTWDPWTDAAPAPLELELLPWGRIAGRIVPPEGATVDELGVELRTQRKGTGGETRIRAFDADGRFESRALASGTYKVTARLREIGVDLARVAELEVHAGRASRAPSLDPLDLSRELRSVELELVDEQRAAVETAELLWRPRRGQSAPADLGEFLTSEKWVPVRAARTRQWLRQDPVDLLVRAPGFLDARVDDVRGEQRIVLRRTRELVFELSPRSERPDASKELWIYAQRDVDGSVVGPVFGARVGADRKARVGVDGPGRFRIALMTTVGFKPMPDALAIAHERCGLVFDVDDATFAQPLVLDVLSAWWTVPDTQR